MKKRYVIQTHVDGYPVRKFFKRAVIDDLREIGLIEFTGQTTDYARKEQRYHYRPKGQR